MHDTGLMEIHPSERLKKPSENLPANHDRRIPGAIIAMSAYCARIGYPPCESSLKTHETSHQALAIIGNVSGVRLPQGYHRVHNVTEQTIALGFAI